jgi:class 3 adenylate cyclase
VLVSGLTAELARRQLPPEVGLRSLGLHQLKDLAEPEHVFQLVHPALLDDFSPLSIVPGNLPARLTSFVKHVQKVAELDALLRRARLVTLTGAGGSGKSRLAVEAAARVSSACPDGAWLVELAAMHDATLAPAAIAAAIGIRVEIGRPVLSTLGEALRTRRLLPFLDNCEHLLEGIAHMIEILLEASPGLRVPCTSREPLHVPGERELSVPPLSAPDPRTVTRLEDVRGADAVKLFSDRAAAVRPSFGVDPSRSGCDWRTRWPGPGGRPPGGVDSSPLAEPAIMHGNPVT